MRKCKKKKQIIQISYPSSSPRKYFITLHFQNKIGLEPRVEEKNINVVEPLKREDPFKSLRSAERHCAPGSVGCR